MDSGVVMHYIVAQTLQAAFFIGSSRSKRIVSDFDADRLIRNTYKVLLTRGMRGTMLLSTDPETQEYLAKLIHVRRRLETAYNMLSSKAGTR